MEMIPIRMAWWFRCCTLLLLGVPFLGLLCLSPLQAQVAGDPPLPDGLYMVLDEEDDVPVGFPWRWVGYNSLFHEGDITPRTRLRLATDDFVPLTLSVSPVAETQQGEKKRLLLTLSEEASGKLKGFTAERVDRTAAIVIDGEAVSAHRIRVALTSGLLQISWCGEYACEVLQARLMRNVED